MLNSNLSDVDSCLQRFYITNLISSANPEFIDSFSGYNYIENGIAHISCYFRIKGGGRGSNGALFRIDGYMPQASTYLHIAKFGDTNFSSVAYTNPSVNEYTFTRNSLEAGEYVMFGEILI